MIGSRYIEVFHKRLLAQGLGGRLESKHRRRDFCGADAADTYRYRRLSMGFRNMLRVLR